MLGVLPGDLPGEDVAVGLRGDVGENLALESGRLQRPPPPTGRLGSKP